MKPGHQIMTIFLGIYCPARYNNPKELKIST